MGNPFEEFKKQIHAHKVEESGWEEVDGPMRCMHKDCGKTAKTGLYSSVAKILTWACPDGHENRLDNFEA